jgi:hypothetical protein
VGCFSVTDPSVEIVEVLRQDDLRFAAEIVPRLSFF